MSATAKSKRPFGFYVCAMGFTFERCAFYTVKYLLAIWIATEAAAGGLGLSSTEGASISAAFVAGTYITPMIGGYIADYWLSPRICVPLGMILMGAGYIVAWRSTSLSGVWIMVILVAVGTGFFKGNLSGVNGLLFHDKDELNSAFSIQYSFVNIGSFIGTTFIAMLPTSGLFGMHTTYTTVFLICGIFLIVDAIWFVGNGKALGDAGKKPFKIDEREFSATKAKDDKDVAPLTGDDYKKITAIVLVTLLSAVFWMVWYMLYLPAYYDFGHGDGADFLNHANWFIGSFEVPTSWFDSMNALCCIVLGPVLAMVWDKKAKSAKGDWSMFKKTALGIMLVGIACLTLMAAEIVRGDGQCSLLWIIAVSLLMSVGEMIFSPMGNSFISKIAPAKVMGLLLGFWPIAVFIAQYVYPKVYAFLGTMDFAKGYGGLGVIIVAVGVILWACSAKLDALEQG